tara:strand:+ start:3545 stop:4735 length:1191 start_codon:yes stop_codon:yes gene_type:complete
MINAEFAILTTTINVPTFLENICKNIKKFKHKNFFFLVIADKKTPKGAKAYCHRIKKRFDVNIIYLSIEDQDKYFKNKYRKIYSLFPYNDAHRRLLGLIYIKNMNPKRVIFIDDDNFVANDVDFLKGHEIVGKKISGNAIYNSSKWPNIYKYVETDKNVPIYPRGFPWYYRNEDSFKIKVKKVKNKIVLANCGFILGDPDIDAVSRLFWKIKVNKINSKNNILIAKGMYCPFNDQNTCIDGKTSLLYYKPISAGRNSDIWTSYMYNKVSAIHDSLVSYGMPHLTQIRNIHDYWKDFDLEKQHNISTDYFAKLLMNAKCKPGKNYYVTFVNLLKKLLLEINKRQSKINLSFVEKNRHYQGIGKKELLKRETESLKYIKKYFMEYLVWLKYLKQYNLQ